MRARRPGDATTAAHPSTPEPQHAAHPHPLAIRRARRLSALVTNRASHLVAFAVTRARHLAAVDVDSVRRWSAVVGGWVRSVGGVRHGFALRRGVVLGLVGMVLVVAGCANGGGLRVEGAEAPPSATPSVALGTPEPGRVRTPEAVDLAAVRDTLLADKRLDSYYRTVLEKCVVITRCLSQGPSVDVMHSGNPQRVVFIHTLDRFVFGVFLIALEPAGPRRVWSLKADQPVVTASPQGDLLVESKVFTIEDKVCCPSGRRVEVYRWNGRQMTKVSSQDQKGD